VTVIVLHSAPSPSTAAEHVVRGPPAREPWNACIRMSVGHGMDAVAVDAGDRAGVAVTVDVVVIGAGQAGLSAGYHL